MPTILPPIRHEDAEYQNAHNDLYLGIPIDAPEHILPPGVSQDDFDQAIHEFVRILGDDSVFTFEAFRDSIDPYEIPQVGVERKTPSAAVCPSSTEQLQAVLQVANKYSIPVWTFSPVKNIVYGGPATRLPSGSSPDGQDSRSQREVRKLKIWPSVPSLGWDSVIGNTFDRGTGFTPTANHHEHIAGLEVTLADGDVVCTSQWAMSTSPSAHLSKYSFGRNIVGLFLQSSFGGVTKMGIWLTPQPQSYMSCSFDMPNCEDVGLITDLFGEMRRNGIMPNLCYVFNIVEWSAIIGKRADLWEREGAIPDSWLKEIQQEIETSHWSFKFSLYGAKEVIQVQYNEIKRTVAECAPTGRLKGFIFSGDGDRLLDPTTVTQRHGGMFVGAPRAYSAYSAIIPLDGKVMVEWYHKAREMYEAEGFDAMCDFFMHGRHAVFVCMLCFDKTNRKQTDAIDRIFHRLFEEGRKMRFAKYRAHVDHMDMVSDQMDFNGHAYRRFVEKIKDTLDPNGILSPGKMGIWSQKYRHLREDASKVENNPDIYDSYGLKANL